jgi:hypothetical protein
MSARPRPEPPRTPLRQRRGAPASDQTVVNSCVQLTVRSTNPAPADPDQHGLRQVNVTAAGLTRHTELSSTPRRTGLRVPDPVFPTKISAGRRSSCSDPLPGGQPDPSPQAEESSVEQLRWVSCLDDERRHPVASADVAGGGHESNGPWPQGQSVSSPVPGPPVISADAAAQVLCDYFLTNAERGDNAANDEFVAELALRMRTGQARSGGESFPRATETTPVPHRGLL